MDRVNTRKKLPEDLWFNVFSDIGTIGQEPNGRSKDVKFMSWNGDTPVIDIRSWNAAGTTPGEGIALHESDLDNMLRDFLVWRKDHNLEEVRKRILAEKSHYKLHAYLSEISNFDKEGWRKELNIVSFDSQPEAMYDLRFWKNRWRNSPGKGIRMTETEVDILMRMLLNYRDGTKKPKLIEENVIDADKEHDKRISYIFDVGMNVDVVAERTNDGKVDVYIEKYAGSGNLLDFMPKNVKEACIAAAKAAFEPAAETKEPKKLIPLTEVAPSSEPEISQPEFGERLSQARRAKDYTQKDLAGAIGVSSWTVSVWENGVHTPGDKKMPILKMAAKVLGCSPDWLLYGKTGRGIRRPAEKDKEASGKPLPKISETPKAAKPAEPETPVVNKVAAADKGTIRTSIKAEVPASPEIPEKVSVSAKKLLESVNTCIVSLPTMKAEKEDVLKLHEIFSGMRSALETQIFFGETEDPDGVVDLSEINEIIGMLPGMSIGKEDKLFLYSWLSGMRASIEMSKL